MEVFQHAGIKVCIRFVPIIKFQSYSRPFSRFYEEEHLGELGTLCQKDLFLTVSATLSRDCFILRFQQDILPTTVALIQN